MIVTIAAKKKKKKRNEMSDRCIDLTSFHVIATIADGHYFQRRSFVWAIAFFRNGTYAVNIWGDTEILPSSSFQLVFSIFGEFIILNSCIAELLP